MKTNDNYSDKVIDYIIQEYNIEIIEKLIVPEYANTIRAILNLHKDNKIDIQTTAIHLVNFIKDQEH